MDEEGKKNLRNQGDVKDIIKNRKRTVRYSAIKLTIREDN